MKLRIILVDDHAMVRGGLRSILEKRDDVEIVAEAGNGRTAVQLVQELSPDIVITDITMPDLNGIEATRQIVDADPSVRVIVLSVHADQQYVLEALKAGASAYLIKNSATAELDLAIDAVRENRTYLSPKVAGLVVDDAVRRPAGMSKGPSSLTPREREVLQLIAEGKTNKEVGEILHVSSKTVETHRAQVMDKLNLRTVAQLTKYAIRHGLTTLEQ